MDGPAPAIPELPELPHATADDREFTSLERESVAHLFHLEPSLAVGLGLHAYDGLVPDLSASAIDIWVLTTQRLLASLDALDPAALSPERRVDRALLRLRLRSSLFDLVEYPYLERLPTPYIGPLELVPYLARPYAPAPVRASAMVRILEGVPKLLKVARVRLTGPLPAPFVQIGLSMAEGLAPHYRDTQEFVRSQAPSEAAAYARARADAEAAVEALLDHLRSALPLATPVFALGPKLFQRLLQVREGIAWPFDRLAQEGWANLRANQARLDALARAQKPPVGPADMLRAMSADHPSASDLIPETERTVEEIRRYLNEHAIVSVPTPEHCRVEPTPMVERAWTTASLDPPGPFETTAYEGVYHVTPVEPEWDAAKQEEWLASFSRPMIRNVSVHEVYPGHYVQFLHFRATTRTLTRRVYFSGAFTEGWAHYVEQLMIEQGYGAERPYSEAAQLQDALLRNVRLLASVGMHTQGMSLEAATDLFVKEAHMDRFPAEREALRGTFNPEYFGYTLGKLAILDARTTFLGREGPGALRAFHDRVLSFGAPPVGFLGPLLFGEPLPEA